MNWSVRVSATLNAASEGLARRLVELAQDASERTGHFRLAVSGGRTPAELYTRLGTEYARRFPWSQTDLFFADERAVPADDPRSNFALVQHSLLSPLAKAGPTVHRIEGELTPISRAAERYEIELRTALGSPGAGPPSRPTFDVILLGVGSDGHTASLFPGAESLKEALRWTVVEPNPHLDPHVPRVSLTLPVIRASRHALFLVAGAEKRPVLERIFSDPARGTPRGALPSACISAGDGVEWFMDTSAAP